MPEARVYVSGGVLHPTVGSWPRVWNHGPWMSDYDSARDWSCWWSLTGTLPLPTALAPPSGHPTLCVPSVAGGSGELCSTVLYAGPGSGAGAGEENGLRKG